MNRKNIKLFLIPAILFAVFLGFGNEARAATTYYVSPTGSDSNNGLISTPFKTIQKAANAVNPGDTVIVANGTYLDTDGNGWIVLMSRAGTSDNWITFKAENKWGAILDGQGQGNKNGIRFTNTAAYVRIEDFEIKNMSAVAISFVDGASAHHMYFYRNKIYDIGRYKMPCGARVSAFGILGEAQYITIDNNLFYRIGRLPGGCLDPWWGDYHYDHAVYLKKNVTVINNVFYENLSGAAIQIDGYSSPPASDWQVINNTFHGTNPGIIKGHIIVWEKLSDSVFRNNISHTPNTAFIYIYPVRNDYSNITVENNISTTSYIISDQNGGRTDPPQGWTLSNNMTSTNPLVLDVANRDFHLLSYSPAIDKGLYYSGRTKDADGNPIVGLPDIGAYEYVGTSPDTTPPASPTGLTVN